MKKLSLTLIFTLLTLPLFAQSTGKEEILLNDEQVARVLETTKRIAVAQKELEAATEVQKRVIAEIQAELGVNPKLYGQLEIIGEKYGFKKKEEKK